MSDFNLIDIVSLIRAEIRKTQVGPVKKIVGKTGERGPQGDAGIQGPQGPRGNTGPQGPKGDKGVQGKQGPAGAKGVDGADGVGIARIDSNIDNSFCVILTDGTRYDIEMPLIDGGNPTEVHYKVSGGGSGGDSSGSVDLSKYVRRPPSSLDDSWLVYKETNDPTKGVSRTWAPVTTDLVATNPEITFRDAKGRFRSTENYEDLTDQLKVNRFIANELDLINAAIANLQAGSVIVADDPPNIEADGQLWLDSNRLELFISYNDGWISTTPLADRVEAGEALQAEILARVEAGEVKQATIETNAMTKGGAQTLTDEHWSIKDDGGNTFAMISDSEITMYHVATPEAPKQVANREYVDTKIAKKGDTMLGNLAMGGHQITGLGTPKQRGHTVSKGYMDDTLAPLEAKINQLEGSIGEYHWNFDSSQNNARAGKFNAKTEAYQLTNLVSEVEYFEFSLTDSDDKNPDFARLQNGDVLRITGPAGERAEWYVRAGSDGSNGLLLMGDLISSTFDEFVDGVVYGATGLSQFDPAGLATTAYVDERCDANREYAETKVSLTGTNVVDTSWRLKSGNATVLSAATSGKIKIYNLDYPSHPEHAATMGYVDDAVVGKKWKWHQESLNRYSDRQIYYYDVDDTTRQFAISGTPFAGSKIQFIPDLLSDGIGAEQITVSGMKDGVKTFIAIAKVRSWQMTNSYIVIRCNKNDFKYWEPEAFEDNGLVTVEYGGLF